MADSKFRESLRDFLTQYPLWTAVDQFLDSKWGKRFLAFLGGGVVTGIGFIASLFTNLGSGWKYGLFGAFVAFGVVALIIYLTKETTLTKPKEVVDASEKTAFTLLDVFLADFTTGSKIIQGFGSDFIQNGVNIGRRDFFVGLYLNFDAHSLFMSLYIPANIHAHAMITWFSDGYQTYLADLRKNIHVWPQTAEQPPPISDNLVFTNRIYIYHENVFSDDELHNLESLYRLKGLAPTFRGSGYLELRRLQATADPNTAPKPLKPTVTMPLSAITLPPIEAQNPQMPERFKSSIGDMAIENGRLFMQVEISNLGPSTSIRTWQGRCGKTIRSNSLFFQEAGPIPNGIRGNNLWSNHRLIQSGETIEGWIAFDVGQASAKEVFSTVSLYFTDTWGGEQLHEVSDLPSWARELKK